jgi:hypothetical protein
LALSDDSTSVRVSLCNGCYDDGTLVAALGSTVLLTHWFGGARVDDGVLTARRHAGSACEIHSASCASRLRDLCNAFAHLTRRLAAQIAPRGFVLLLDADADDSELGDALTLSAARLAAEVSAASLVSFASRADVAIVQSAQSVGAVAADVLATTSSLTPFARLTSASVGDVVRARRWSVRGRLHALSPVVRRPALDADAADGDFFLELMSADDGEHDNANVVVDDDDDDDDDDDADESNEAALGRASRRDLARPRHTLTCVARVRAVRRLMSSIAQRPDARTPRAGIARRAAVDRLAARVEVRARRCFWVSTARSATTAICTCASCLLASVLVRRVLARVAVASRALRAQSASCWRRRRRRSCSPATPHQLRRQRQRRWRR